MVVKNKTDHKPAMANHKSRCLLYGHVEITKQTQQKTLFTQRPRRIKKFLAAIAAYRCARCVKQILINCVRFQTALHENTPSC